MGGKVFHRELAIPLWIVVFCAVALSVSPGLLPSLTTLLAIAVIAFTIPAIVRWWRPSRALVAVLPAVEQDPARAGITLTAGTRTRTLDEAIDARIITADDGSDLVRMDDDGGWHKAQPPAPPDGHAYRRQKRLA